MVLSITVTEGGKEGGGFGAVVEAVAVFLNVEVEDEFKFLVVAVLSVLAEDEVGFLAGTVTLVLLEVVLLIFGTGISGIESSSLPSP